MQVRVEQVGGAELARDLAKAPETIRATIAKEAFAIGSRAVRYIRQAYRTTASATSTARRTGQLASSYAHDVKREARDVELSVGAIKPSAGGQVPIHARVHEGFDFAGNRVERFIIKPKNKARLAFNIPGVGWRSASQVILKPRPALEPTSPAIIKALEDAAGKAAADAL